jgi:type I restriction enzyme S subunit
MSFDVAPFGSLFSTPQKNGLTRPKKVRGSGLPMVNMGELFAHPRIHNLVMDLVPVSDSERHFLLEPEDLLFARQSLVLEGAGQCSIFVGNKMPSVFESHLIRCRLDKSISNPYFYFYFFRAPTGRTAIEAIAEQGAGASGIRGSDLVKLFVPCPPKVFQDAVAEILTALDDRIVLLRETNTTLEGVAQALFKSWFVDFDPVHAKQQDRIPEDAVQGIASAAKDRMPITALDEATAALFPDSFEESELGLVPREWNALAIREVVEGVYDGPHATPPESDDGPIFLGIKNLTGTGLNLSDVRHINEDQWLQWTRRVTPGAGDIVFSYEATLGFFALIPPDIRCCLGRRLALIRPLAKEGFGHFWFHQFIAPPFQKLLEKHTIHGATVNRIALKHFPSYLVLNPPSALKSAFENLVAPLWSRIHENQAQAQTLATLRDTLLPRLISGQLRLPEAVNLIDGVL